MIPLAIDYLTGLALYKHPRIAALADGVISVEQVCTGLRVEHPAHRVGEHMPLMAEHVTDSMRVTMGNPYLGIVSGGETICISESGIIHGGTLDAMQ